MSVQSEITRLANAKTALATAIEGKGVTVPEGTKLDGMAALVEAISAGGGGNNLNAYLITYTPAEDYTSETVIEIGDAPPISDISFFAIQNQNTANADLRGHICIGQSEEFSGISDGLVTWYRYTTSSFATKYFRGSMLIGTGKTLLYIEDGLLKLRIYYFGLLAGDTFSIIVGGHA